MCHLTEITEECGFNEEEKVQLFFASPINWSKTMKIIVESQSMVSAEWGRKVCSIASKVRKGKLRIIFAALCMMVRVRTCLPFRECDILFGLFGSMPLWTVKEFPPKNGIIHPSQGFYTHPSIPVWSQMEHYNKRVKSSLDTPQKFLPLILNIHLEVSFFPFWCWNILLCE